MTKGITNKADQVYNEVRVTIMGDFRLKWFESGTKERRLRKNKANRGRIRATRFFTEARQNAAGEISAAMEREFEKQIKKILG